MNLKQIIGKTALVLLVGGAVALGKVNSDQRKILHLSAVFDVPLVGIFSETLSLPCSMPIRKHFLAVSLRHWQDLNATIILR